MEDTGLWVIRDRRREKGRSNQWTITDSSRSKDTCGHFGSRVWQLDTIVLVSAEELGLTE